MKSEGDLFEHKDEVLLFQIYTVHDLLGEMGITIQEFLELDEKYSFLSMLRTGYEWFHLTGIKGIVAAFQKIMRGESAF